MMTESIQSRKLPITKVVKVLEPFLRQFGSFQIETPDSCVIRFSFTEFFLDVISGIQQGRKLGICILVGSIPYLRRTAERSRVNIKWLIPKTRKIRNYEQHWTYFTETEMCTILESIRDYLLNIYLDPLFKNPTKLRSIVTDRLRIEMIEEHNAAVNRENGEKAFRSGDFLTAVKSFEAINPEGLKLSEKKKLDIARKRLNQGTDTNN